MNKTAIVLRENISEIMALWQEEVTKDVSAAQDANQIALFNQLPSFIEDIADILERFHTIPNFADDKIYSEITENSKHHGTHRATTSSYTVEQVVHEYIIFHRVLTDYINSKGGFDQKMSDTLKYAIETSILNAVGAYSRSIQEMQEKLIGTLAHDIRNPLSAAKLSLEMMERDKTGKWVAKTRITAQRSVKKAIDLIEGLMNGITVKAGEGMLLNFEKADILKDIRYVYSESKEVYTHEINLICNADNIIGIFDRTAIRRLLENLIGNAVKYGTTDKPITVTVEDDLDAIEIKVNNFGNPIPVSEQEQIFKFMGSTKKDKRNISGSFGMGLTLTQIVAEAHGGDINLTSNKINGTTFTVNLMKEFNEVGKRRAKLICNRKY